VQITDTQQASDTALFISSVAEYLPPLLQYSSHKALQPVQGSCLLNYFPPTICVLCYFLPIAYIHALYIFQNVIFLTWFRSSNWSFRHGFPPLDLLHITILGHAFNVSCCSIYGHNNVPIDVTKCKERFNNGGMCDVMWNMSDLPWVICMCHCCCCCCVTLTIVHLHTESEELLHGL